MELFQFVIKSIEIKLSVKDDGHTWTDTAAEKPHYLLRGPSQNESNEGY